VQSVLFVIVLFLAWAMVLAGWWCWSRSGENVAPWRKKVGLLAVTANTLAITIPFATFFWQFARFNYAHYLPLIDWRFVLPACLACSLCGAIAGVLGPPRIRFATAMAGVIVGSIVVSIPIGIL
jgi:hypothetical protein